MTLSEAFDLAPHATINIVRALLNLDPIKLETRSKPRSKPRAPFKRNVPLRIRREGDAWVVYRRVDNSIVASGFKSRVAARAAIATITA